MDAAIDIIRTRGVDALTTVSVTEAAGIAQSGFYLHFKNVDDCKRSAAEQVAHGIRQFVADHRRTSGRQSPGDPAALANHFQAVLSLFQTERFCALLIRNRHDLSALGLVLRQLLDQLRTDLAADLHEQWAPLLLEGHDPPCYDIYANLILGMVMAAGEALLEQRLNDPKLLARELTAATVAMTTAVIGHGS